MTHETIGETWRRAYSMGLSHEASHQLEKARRRTTSTAVATAIGLALIVASALLGQGGFLSGIGSGMVAAGVYGIGTSLTDRRELSRRLQGL